MVAEPSFEQFRTRGTGPLAWLRVEPGPREGLWLGLVLALLAMAPVLVARYPQMVDYPAHLARYHVMLEQANSSYLQRFYGFEWRWGGNLGADILIRPLAALFPLETAGRILAAIVPLLTGLGILAVEWVLRRRIGIGAFLAFALIWSPALLLGFLNFALSLALALFAFAGWVRLENWRWRALLFVPISVAVWLCHVSGWGVLGLLVFGYEWHRHRSWRALIAPIPLALPAVLMVAVADGGGEMASYGPAITIYKLAIWKQAMRDAWQGFDYASAWFLGAAAVLALLLRRYDGRLGWAALLFALASLALPRHIVGGDLVDARMVSTALMIGCLAISWRAPRWVLWLAPLLFLVRLGITTEDWRRESLQTGRILSALEALPQGARVANLVVTERSQWGYNGQEHIGGYAVIRRDALINSNFALPKIHMLTMREGGSGFRDPTHRLLHFAGRPIDLSEWAPAKGMDYLWYVGEKDPVALPPGARIIWRGNETFVARLANPPPRS